MTLLQKIFSSLGYVKYQAAPESSNPANTQAKPKYSQKFGYSAANNNRLNADWRLASVGPNHDLRYALETVRNRARDLVNNDDYAKGYIRQMKANVIGPFGFTPRFNPKERDKKFRDNANRIKDKFFEWSEQENCSISGDKDFLDFQNLAMTYAPRDGEFAIRLIIDKKLKFGFALQMLQIELLDELYTDVLPGNRIVVLGIEYDKTTLRRTAFYFRNIPIETQVYGYITTVGGRQRIPAEEIIFGFDQEYENQSRGISWMVQTMSSMRMLSAYDESTLINARMRAMIGGFLNTDKDAQQVEKGDGEDADGNYSWELENGIWKQLPPGVTATYSDNDFPSAQYEMYVNQNLRKQSVGLGVAGSVHSGNYRDVNFSSERARQIAIRDNYMLIQEWLIRRLFKPIGKTFLREAYITGQITYPLSEFDRYAKILWSGRRWAYVNPEQEMNANQMAWQLKTKSVSQIIYESDSPYEPEEVFQMIEDDIAMAKKHGFEISTDIKQPSVPNETPAEDSQDPADKVVSEANKLLKIKKNGVHHE